MLGPQAHKSHFCVEIYRKNAGPGFRGLHFVRVRSRNAHGHFTTAILCGNLQENAAHQYDDHLDSTPGLNWDCSKNPSSVATLFGE